jgi:zona occludens toxin (predicted ATPase)
MSDEEFERQFAQATKRGERRLQTEPRAESAYYDTQHGRVVIELTNGSSVLVHGWLN